MRILVVDDEEAQRNIVGDILIDSGYPVTVAASGDEAIETLADKVYAVVLTDLKMPGIDGIELLQRVKERSPETQVIIMTAFGTIPSAVNAIKGGAYDYLTKPFKKDELLRVVKRALERAQLLQENLRLKSEVDQTYHYHNLIGGSTAMKTVYTLIERIKDIDATILITGESGTGKEMVAKAIHYSGKRKNGPFIAINCGAIPENLIESELFGHEKGAFTGAIKTYIGKFEQAQKGTIFLDEVGTMRQDLQTRLLRVLQERVIERIGSNTPVTLDVRVIAATNEDLQRKAEQGSFRNDLYHRLNVFNIPLEPLRKRRSDIVLLAKHFVEKYTERYGKRPIHIHPGAVSLLEKYHYPGNIRELENIIEKAVILCDANTLSPHELMIPEPTATDAGGEPYGSIPEQEISLIKQALRKNEGSIKGASQSLGISYKTLQYRLKKYNINKNHFK